MQIDGKLISKLNPTSSLSNTKKQSVQSSEHSQASIGQASEFALNQSGLDQRLRQTNDQITQFQLRQNTLRNNEAKLNQVSAGNTNSDKLVDIKNDIHKSGLFNGTNFEQTLNKLLSSEKPLVESIQKTISSELNTLSNLISDQLSRTLNDDRNATIRENPEQLLNQFQTLAKNSPETLSAAYTQLNPEMVHGLLGNQT